MKLRKMIKAGCVLTFATLLLTACSLGKKDNSSEKSTSKGSVNLRISWWGGDTRHEAMRNAIKEFENENPNIKVKSEYSGFDGYQEKFTTELSGGTAPDVARIDAQWLDQYQNHLEDLNNYKSILKLDNFKSDSLKASTINGKLLGTPLSTIYMPLFFNKTMLDKYGIETPKTWEDIIAMKDKLPDNVYPLTTGFSSKIATPMFIFKIMTTQTGKSIGNSKDKLQYTKKEFKDAITYYKMLVDKKIIPSKKLLDNAGAVDGAPNPGLVDGTQLSFFQWDTGVSVEEQQLKDAGYEIAVAGFPTMKNGKSNGNFSKPSAVFSVPESSKHKKEAAKLISFLLNDKAALQEIKLENGFPDSSAGKKIVDDMKLATPFQQEAHDVGLENANDNLSFVYKWQRARIDDLSLDVFTKLDYGNITVDEAASMLYKGFKEEENNFEN